MNDYQSAISATATALAAKIRSSWASEESLEALYRETFPTLTYDRRSSALSPLFKKIVTDTWVKVGLPTAPKYNDVDKVMRALYGALDEDYNLFTQVLLNVQDYLDLRIDAQAAASALLNITKKYASVERSPFAPKAKFVRDNPQATDIEYNRDLDVVRSLCTSRVGATWEVRSIPASITFGVTPIGVTPALFDSANFSTMGAAGDRYIQLPPGRKAFYLQWAEAKQLTELQPDGSFKAHGIHGYSFRSKSGGEMLNNCLYARRVAAAAYLAGPPGVLVVPRLNSVLVVCGATEGGYLNTLSADHNFDIVPDARRLWY